MIPAAVSSRPTHPRPESALSSSFKQKAKVWLHSRSREFTRDYFDAGGAPGRAAARGVYRWHGLPVHYRRGTSDARLVYQILLRGRKGEYVPPRDARLDPASVETVLDIGANIGVSALFFADLFPRATVHAFEPDPGNCEILRANAAAGGRIVVHPFALGAEDGELRLFDSDDTANFGGFSAHGAGIDPARSKMVPVRHAGRALAALGVRKAEVIKIDTEGSEWEILTALERPLLESARLILGELHGRRDFELLAWLQPMFDIGMRKAIRSRLFNFHALRKA
jgi:FkbM family methyltransferase